MSNKSGAVDLDALRAVFEEAWDARTSYCPEEWDESQPSCGQCYVTARLVHHFLGGEIIRCFRPSRDVNHYWNRLPNGREIDLTADQFGCQGFDPPSELRDLGRVRAPIKL